MTVYTKVRIFLTFKTRFIEQGISVKIDETRRTLNVSESDTRKKFGACQYIGRHIFMYYSCLGTILR